MFLKILEITPTSVLTFRKVPMSHKIINTYNFIPPTTLSGFLYRLLKLGRGEELPTPKKFKSEKPEINEYYILETKKETIGIFSLGAYPVDLKSSVTFKSFRMGYQHLGKGHSLADGLDIFDPSYENVINLITQKIRDGQLKDDNLGKFQEEFEKSRYNKYYKRGVFKAVMQGYGVPTFQAFKKEERRQPLDWHFCFAERFYGFLISEDPNLLNMFDDVENYGYKIGKEGFAYISKVHKTSELVEANGEFVSSTIIPTTSTGIRLKKISEVESVYYFDLKTQKLARDMFALNGTLAEGGFYKAILDGLEISVPKVTVNLLKGV
jgi:hypothetical protein